MNAQLALREQWPWDKEFLRLYLIIPSLLGVILSAALFPKYGGYALCFLLGIPLGYLLNFIYGTAGKSKIAFAVPESIGKRWSEILSTL